jgi:transcriptional regulator with XRE-family HTH domain
MSARVRRARQSARLTQADLARRLSVSRSAVAQWESPSGSAPATTNLAELARALHCSFEWLATGRGPRGSASKSSSSADSAEIAVNLRHFARDDDEERALGAFRSLQAFDRRVALAIMEQLAARPSGKPRRSAAPESGR